MKGRIWPVVAVLSSVIALSSCASVNVASLPQPGRSYGGGYDIVMEFDNVLNLPDRAKVVMDGTTVGVVTGVAVTANAVDVSARIDPNAVVPSNIHAALQQATVLGDIYVSLDRPETNQPAVPALSQGGRIPLAHTTSPPQLEDTIANMANFVASGSIQRIQNTIIELDRIQPPGGEPAIHKMAAQVAADLGDLSDNIDTVDKWFNGLTGTVDVMHRQLPVYQHIFSPQGMKAFYRILRVWGYVGRLIPSVGSVYSNGYWLVPFLNSLGGAFGALQQSKWAFEDEWPAWQRLFTNFFLPEDKYPAINITSIVGPDGRELSGNVRDVLRILGAAP